MYLSEFSILDTYHVLLLSGMYLIEVHCTLLWYPQRQMIGLPKTSIDDVALCLGQDSIFPSSLAQ